jgi:hypothetical protein
MSKPWLELIGRFHADAGLSNEDATNMAILEYLQHGDLRPLQEMLEAGFRPSEKVLRFLGEMMNPAGKTPYRIEKPTKRGRGRAHHPDNYMRNLKLAEEVMILMKALNLNEKDAFQKVGDANRVSSKTVRDAYRQVQRNAKNN